MSEIESDDDAREWFVFDDGEDPMDDEDKLEALIRLRQELAEELLKGATADIDTSEEWMTSKWFAVYRVTFPQLDEDATVTVCYGVPESLRIEAEACGNWQAYETLWAEGDGLDCWASSEVVAAIRDGLLTVEDVKDAAFAAVEQQRQ